MRSSKRRTIQPLNFTPDEPKPRTEERPRSLLGQTSKSAPLRSKPAEENEGMQASSLATRRGPPFPGLARYAYLSAGLAALAWAGMLFAYTIGYVGGVAGLSRAPMQLAVVCLMAILPAVFIFAAAFAIRQGARLAAEARWTRALAEDFVTPAAIAAARTGDLAAGVRAEIERASAAAVAAHGQLISVREALSGETDRLSEAAAQAQHTSRVVGETLARERDAVASLLTEMRGQSDALASGVERQSRMVGEASDLARTQLQEAEATLASGAERLTAATSDAGATAREAGEGLARQAERLDVAAAALSERLRFLDARLNDQRHALSNLLHTLDTDQDDVAARLETHKAQMLEVIAEARASAAELGAASAQGGQALRELIGGALDQTREIAATVRGEQEALRAEAVEARLSAQTELHQALDALARAGESARRAALSAAEQAEATAHARVGAARREVDQLGELAFAAGQRADQAFQARLSEARRLIEQTAALIEEAGQRAGERIDAGLGASRGALGELASALGDIDARLARLPDMARGQAEAVRASMERSLSELTAAARRAAEETQGLDATFQDRIRRNYETLSEAVRLMGRVAGAVDFNRDRAPARTETASPEPKPVPAPQGSAPPPDPFAALRSTAEPTARSGVQRSDQPFSPAARPEPHQSEAAPAEPPRAEPVAAPRPPAFAVRASSPAPVFGRAAAREADAAQLPAGPADLLLEPQRTPEPARAGPTSTADDISVGEGLRPRLRFTPTEADEALKAVFTPKPEVEAATAARPPARKGEWDADLDEWTWKDLLTSMDDVPTDTDALAEQMIREIETLGVDAAALLPRARVEEVASALVEGDAAAARDGVRRLAPAAIRRLSRRVLTDRALREQVDRYVERYQLLLRDAADPHGAVELLGSDAGRAYLLLEAAIGDL